MNFHSDTVSPVRGTRAKPLGYRLPRNPSEIIVMVLLQLFSVAHSCSAGSIFLTGHDPDVHAGDTALNPAGAAHINQAAIRFILDPAFNSFAASGVNKFLLVESNISPPPGHLDSERGLIASGFSPGIDFERHDASDLNTELSLLGIKYSGIVAASDFGGLLTQSELDILNTRSSDIIDFLNTGGGIYAMAEGNSGARLTPRGGWFGFLPFVVSSTQFNQGESSNTLTPFGASLGLTISDINGNFSHNIFTSTGGLAVVDFDGSHDILSLAGRGTVDPSTGLVPEPGSVVLVGTSIAMFLGILRRRTTQGGRRVA